MPQTALQTTNNILTVLPTGHDKVRSDKNLYVKRGTTLGRDVSRGRLSTGLTSALGQ